MSLKLRCMRTLLFTFLLVNAGIAWGADEAVKALDLPAVEPIVTVRWLNGTPSILKTNRWISLQVGETIPAGARIRTATSDSVEVILDEPGHIIAFGPDSEAVIDLRKASVELKSGELIGSIRKTRKENTTVIVYSGFGQSTVKAADFRITINPAPTLSVLSGIVEFLPARGSVGVAAPLRAGSHVVASSEVAGLEKMNAASH
jgi:hypothetical protein